MEGTPAGKILYSLLNAKLIKFKNGTVVRLTTCRVDGSQGKSRNSPGKVETYVTKSHPGPPAKEEVNIRHDLIEIQTSQPSTSSYHFFVPLTHIYTSTSHIQEVVWSGPSKTYHPGRGMHGLRPCILTLLTLPDLIGTHSIAHYGPAELSPSQPFRVVVFNELTQRMLMIHPQVAQEFMLSPSQLKLVIDRRPSKHERGTPNTLSAAHPTHERGTPNTHARAQ